jgi:hypothetical protein
MAARELLPIMICSKLAHEDEEDEESDDEPPVVREPEPDE